MTVMELPDESPSGKEYITSDAREIPTRVQRVASWIIEKASYAKDIATARWHSFEEGDRDHFYYGPEEG